MGISDRNNTHLGMLGPKFPNIVRYYMLVYNPTNPKEFCDVTNGCLHEADMGDAATRAQTLGKGASSFRMLTGGSLTREQFLLRELRIVATLRSSGSSDDEIVRRAVSENLFQFPTTRQSERIARACLRRLDALERPDLVTLVADAPHGGGDSDQAAQCCLYAIARQYALMRVFLVEEVALRYRTLDDELTPEDINAFFTGLVARSDLVASWAPSTIAKLKTVIRSSLAHAGMLASSRSAKLIPIVLDSTVRDGMVANGDADLLPAFNCFDACADEGAANSVPARGALAALGVRL